MTTITKFKARMTRSIVFLSGATNKMQLYESGGTKVQKESNRRSPKQDTCISNSCSMLRRRQKATLRMSPWSERSRHGRKPGSQQTGPEKEQSSSTDQPYTSHMTCESPGFYLLAVSIILLPVHKHSRTIKLV